MTNLRRLKVSLTKHNAHKVAVLLKAYSPDKVLDRLDEVHAEPAQAKKNLSVGASGDLPALWTSAKRLGPDAIDNLVFVAIVFSHHQLIEAMQGADERQGPAGKILRDKTIDGKAYTNFARVMDQLGVATSLEYEGVSFDCTGILEMPGLGPLVRELLELKLRSAGWTGETSIESECTRLEFHRVFGVSAKELQRWLSVGARPVSADPSLPAKDRQFFDSPTDQGKLSEFRFRPGHVVRGTVPITKEGSRRSQASRLHNDLQNRLYEYLRAEHGAKRVGTEIETGYGTSIDLVTKLAGETAFYEIKTCSSVRTSIRQALPQLLEYAHWPKDKRAQRLVVVSHLPITPDAQSYVQFLREMYGLPIEYRQFDLEKNSLS